MGPLREDRYTLMFWVKLLEKIKIRSMSNNFFRDCAVYEIIWKIIVEPGRPRMTIWRMRIAC